jgi:DNA-binding transcriptional ArsR family regulator
MENQFKQIASLIGDPTRAIIMWTLLDGKAFTATELAIAADTSPQNISMHLAKLIQADLLCTESQGRHRYYKFSRKEVAYAIEAMANLLPYPSEPGAISEKSSDIKFCRTCYDHLAGRIGVLITDSLLQQKIIVEATNNNFDVSRKGQRWFSGLGIDIEDLHRQRRSFVKPCLDWSERRHHMAGSLAASLLDTMLTSDWMRRTKNSRAVVITGKGRKKLHEYFKLSV